VEETVIARELGTSRWQDLRPSRIESIRFEFLSLDDVDPGEGRTLLF